MQALSSRGFLGRLSASTEFDSSCPPSKITQFSMWRSPPRRRHYWTAAALRRVRLAVPELNGIMQNSQFLGRKKASFLHFFGVLWKGIVAYDWELGVAISKIIIWLLISNLSISNLLLILMLFSFPKERWLTKKFQAISYWNVSLLTTPIFRQKI